MNTDELYYSAIDLLKTLIEIPSLSREENEAANKVENFIIEKGLHANRKNNNI